MYIEKNQNENCFIDSSHAFYVTTCFYAPDVRIVQIR